MTWTEHGEGTQFRPPSQSFNHPKLFGWRIVASPVTSPNLEKFGGDYGSIPVAYTVDTETFNREVGWVVSGWHWSVVGMRGTWSGDELTLEAAQKAAEDALRSALGRKRSVIQAIWGADQ